MPVALGLRPSVLAAMRPSARISLLLLMLAPLRADGGPVVVEALPNGALSLSNGAVRIEASGPSRSSVSLLRFYTLAGSTKTEVLRSFHADAAVDAPLYSQANPFAGYRVLLHDHLTEVRAGAGGTPTLGSLVLERPATSDTACGALGSSNRSTPPPLSANCSVLASARVSISLRAGAVAFAVNATATFRESAPGAAWVEYVLASFEWAPAVPPSFIHTPHLKRVSTQHWNHVPSSEYIAADRTFNSPVVALESTGGGGAALLADTVQLNAFMVDARGARPVTGKQNTKWTPNATFVDGKYVRPTFPAGFDVQAQPPVGPERQTVVSFGMLDYEAEQHVYFKHKNDGSMVRQIQSDQLRFGFEVLLQAEDSRDGHVDLDLDHEQRLFQRAAQRAWNATGSAELRRGRPQVMPFAEYARVCYPAALNASSPVGGPPDLTAERAFVEWVLPDGSHAGGLRTMAGGPAAASVVFDKIHNIFWWNNQHMATGFGLWGRELGKAVADVASQALGQQLLRVAQLTLNMTLSAPIATATAGGLWDSVCTWSPEYGCNWTGALHKITVPFNSACQGNPTCDPGFTGAYWDFTSDWKSASSVSKTTVMLLRYYSDVDPDERILPRVKLHADWLVKVAGASAGGVPEWWVSSEPAPTPSPAPPPPPSPPRPPLPPPPAGTFKQLGNLDPNGFHPTGPLHVASELACQAECFHAKTPPCAAGVFLNGSVRFGECWLGQHDEAPRTDFCGAKPGQSCAGFTRVTATQQVSEPEPALSSAGWLDFNAHGGIHLQALADYAKLPAHSSSERAPYEAAARAVAQQLMRDILPTQRWADVETFYSCSNKPESAYDNFTQQPPRNTLSTGWAVDGLTSMYELTGERQYLSAAEEAADYASLYQATYEPMYLERPKLAHVFGGMRSQNTDAEWLDMRQAVVSEGFIRLGNASGRQDLMERGVAAARASLSLITEERTQANDYPIPNLDASSGRPHVAEFLEPENVDHEGLPQLPARSGPDWGEVGGLAAIAFARHRFGGAFMDAARGLCIGIDGVTLDGCAVIEGSSTLTMQLRSLMAADSLERPWKTLFGVTLKIHGLEASKTWRLQVSGRDLGNYSSALLHAGVEVMVPYD